jgi:hypothetical protein
MRKTYVLYTGGLSNIDNRFHFYEIEVYSSLSKIEREIEKRIEINKGFNVRRDEGYNSTGTLSNTMITYECLSTDNTPMTIRYQLLVKKMN